jgi:hypothetical protein
MHRREELPSGEQLRYATLARIFRFANAIVQLLNCSIVNPHFPDACTPFCSNTFAVISIPGDPKTRHGGWLQVQCAP